MPVVGHDRLQFMARAMDVLREHGRRRVAVLTIPSGGAGFWPKLEAIIADRGLKSPPLWTQAVMAQEPCWIRRTVSACFIPTPA